MKLVIAVVHNRDRGKVTDELVEAGYKFTVIASTGGFLREGNATLLFGVEEDDMPALFDILGRNCPSREQVVNVAPFEGAPHGGFIPSPVKVPVGGGVAFVLDVEQFVRF